MICVPSVTIVRLWNPIHVWVSWRWHWAAFPAAAGCLGRLGVYEGLPPFSPPPGPSFWLGLHVLILLCRLLLLGAECQS